jgi:hypothetical protein
MISEKELQKWFENKADQRSIKESIYNGSFLNTVPISQRRNLPRSERYRLAALDNAKIVYDRLEHARYISGDRSVSVEGKSQLRPDIIIITDEANCMLIELKTNKKAERQTVQELLAYSASIKSQLPYLNEHMFIIVASQWDVLLQQAVKSLIMDGKLVLPLTFDKIHDGEYQLYIKESLFCCDKKVNYNPSYAMIPHTLATSLYYSHSDQMTDRGNSSLCKIKIINYLRNVGYRLLNECSKIKQSGFFMIWRDMRNKNYEVISLTVVTVNQFWHHSESTPTHIAIDTQPLPVGLSRLQQRAANLAGKKILDSYKKNRPHETSDDLDFIFINSDIHIAQSEFYPKSSLSFDLLWRYTDKDREKEIIDLRFSQPFEYGGHVNLISFLRDFKEIRQVSIEHLATFGDVADFFEEKNIHSHSILFNYSMFLDLMKEFSSKNR